jgi:hypothetical protein
MADVRARPWDLSVGAVASIALTTLVGFAWGRTFASPLAAWVGALGGALAGFAAIHLARAIRLHRALVGPTPPDVRGLPPEQALAVLTAGLDRDRAARPISDVLVALARIREQARDDPEAAIVQAEELRTRWPTSPAIPVELARLHRARGRDGAATVAASQAIALALRGGMNSVAVAVWLEHPAPDRIEVAAADRERLARALEAHGRAEAAQACRGRPAPESSPDPHRPP